MESVFSTTEPIKMYQSTKNEIRRSKAIQKAYRKYRMEHDKLKASLGESESADDILWQHTQQYNQLIKNIFNKYKTNETVFLSW